MTTEKDLTPFSLDFPIFIVLLANALITPSRLVSFSKMSAGLLSNSRLLSFSKMSETVTEQDAAAGQKAR
jgi:hypothetical protein